MSTGGGCEAAMATRSICGLVEFRECCELLHRWRFALRLKGAVHDSYAMPAMLHGSEAWCLNESHMGILRRTERSTLRAMCGVQLKDRKISTDLLLMMGSNETMNQLAMTNSVRWYGYVMRREDGHVLRTALDVEVESQRKR